MMASEETPGTGLREIPGSEERAGTWTIFGELKAAVFAPSNDKATAALVRRRSRRVAMVTALNTPKRDVLSYGILTVSKGDLCHGNDSSNEERLSRLIDMSEAGDGNPLDTTTLT